MALFMRLLLRILRHECRQTWRDGRFTALAAVVGVLLGLAIVAGWRDVADHRRTVDRAQVEQRQRWTDMIAMPPHLAAHAGTMLFRPWPSLAALDPGVNAETGTAIFLEAHKRNFFDHRPLEDDPLPSLFPRLGVALVLQWLIPLLILVAAPALIAFEREQGTWRLALSTGVSAQTLAFAKAAGTALPVAVLLLPVGFAAGWLGTIASADLSDAGARTALLGISYAGYYLVILFLTLAISAWATSARQALGIACLVWIAFVFVVPRASQEVARWRAPAPSIREFTDDLLAAQARQPDFSVRQDAVRARLKEQFGMTREIDLPVSPYGLTLYEGEEHEIELYDQAFDRLFSLYAVQQRIVRTASLLSPTIAIDAVSSAMAGTDWAHQRDFADQGEAYRRVLVQSLNRALTYGGAAAQYGEADPSLYRSIPPFRYDSPGVSFAVAACAGSLAMLGMWLAAAMAAAVLTLSWSGTR
jgi:ABC-2 type transport system permease protein